MKLFLPAFFLAIPGAIADFWMVYTRRYTQTKHGENAGWGTSFVQDMREWTCKDDAYGHKMWPDHEDVSGHKDGVRIKPWNTQYGPLWHDPLLTVEMNTKKAPPGHHTIYVSRGYSMVNVKNEKTGQCHLNRSFLIDLDCWMDQPNPKHEPIHISINGSSMFFCESDIQVSKFDSSWDQLSQDSVATILS
ncbi:hypothetical protein HD806DRAFT_535298 [Xylariaceae sp. AK1471]|nr:hypothetical protein HD806DRAFT_535298 [Xylariaceae sp. AK1471]